MSSGRHIATLAVVNMGITLAGMLTTVVIAWIFGASRLMDIWFAAGAAEALMMRLVQTGQLSEVFLPEYVRLRERQGREEAFACFAVVLNWVLLASLVLAVIGACISTQIASWIGPGFAGGDADLLRALFLGLLPVLPLQVAAGMQQMLGNAERWYGRFEIPVFIGAVVGLCVILAGHGAFGVWCLVACQWTSQGVAFLGRWIQLRRGGYRHRWILSRSGFRVWPIFAQLGHALAYIIATQLFAFRFKAALTLLHPGALSVYSYAETFYSRTGSLFLRPVSTVFFTNVSEAVAKGSEAIRDLVRKALDQYLMAYFLLMAVVVPSCVHLLSALWGGPKFGPESIRDTAMLLTVFFVAQVCEAHSMVHRKLNIALGGLGRQYWGNTLVQVALVFLAPVLVVGWGLWGAAAVPLLNTLGFALANAAVTHHLRRGLVTFFPMGSALRWIMGFIPGVIAGRWVGDWIGGLIIPQGGLGLNAKAMHLVSGGMGAATCLLICVLVAKPGLFAEARTRILLRLKKSKA